MTDQTQIETRLLEWVAEAIEIRHGSWGDEEGLLRIVQYEEGFSAIEHELRRVRARSDRMDELLGKVTQAKGIAKRAEDQAKLDAEIAYDQATRKNGQTRPENSFESARDRHAAATLDSLDQKIEAARAARIVSVSIDAYEIVKQKHWQLDAIRKDLRASLHALQFETSLER